MDGGHSFQFVHAGMGPEVRRPCARRAATAAKRQVPDLPRRAVRGGDAVPVPSSTRPTDAPPRGYTYDAWFPLPKPDAEPAVLGFCAARRCLSLQRCRHCGDVHFRCPVCPACLSEQQEWVPASGRGTLFSWCEFHKGLLGLRWPVCCHTASP